MTKAAIMQPQFLPWAGYWSLIDQADVFILDDLAAVSLKSWQMRNRIRTRDGQVIWLSVPTNAKRGMPINQVQVIDNGWHKKHLRTIQAAYGHTPGFPLLVEPLGLGLTTGFSGLSGMTGFLIRRLANLLGITTPIVTASQLGEQRPGMAERIIDLCHTVDADVLLDTPGAAGFLNQSMLEDIHLKWHHYTPVPYPQDSHPWLSHLSIIDLIAHTADEALAVIRAGNTDA